MGLPSALFVSSEVHAREVELPDGSTHTLHFKELPAIDFRKFQLAEMSDDDEVKAHSMARLIAASVVEPDGKPALDFKRASTLKPEMADKLVGVILEVNGFGKKKPA